MEIKFDEARKKKDEEQFLEEERLREKEELRKQKFDIKNSDKIN